ncbi:uncharacterized protein LOC122000412 [Zingiber officinale]|uniref:Uncharacterized protein n=1 Tax=Zingiber officinale TaxID=94328 RepID=A0A8J5FVB7_ZINOF|nr:uncharacterized protein LOC122000412 [Zingiber officinale]KAG6493575.1 hypothetical protein ZIOFF_048567 [Zingiber officinale]
MPKKRKAAKRKKTAVAIADLPAKDNGNHDGRVAPLPEEIKEHDGASTASSSSVSSSSPREHHCSRPAEEFSQSEPVACDGSTEGAVLVQNNIEEESSIVVKKATFSSTTESFPKSKDSIVEATKYQKEHEEFVDESAVPVEKIIVLAEEKRQVDEIALAEGQVKVVLLPDADETAKQLNEHHGDHCCGGRDETLPTPAVVALPPPVIVVSRTSWWSCCGLLDVFAGSGGSNELSA